MARFGAPDNTTATAAPVQSSLSYWAAMPNFPGGTIDSVLLYIGDGGLGPGNNARVAVLYGGVSDSDPTGATLVWEATINETDLPGYPSTGSPAWFRINTIGSPSVAAGQRLWVYWKGSYSVQQYYISSNFGDVYGGGSAQHWISGYAGIDETIAFDATMATGTTDNIDFGAWKMAINYTAIAPPDLMGQTWL